MRKASIIIPYMYIFFKIEVAILALTFPKMKFGILLEITSLGYIKELIHIILLFVNQIPYVFQ